MSQLRHTTALSLVCVRPMPSTLGSQRWQKDKSPKNNRTAMMVTHKLPFGL